MSIEPVPAIPAASTDYRAGDLLIEVGVRRVTRDGLELNITGLSFDLLLTLVRAAPNLVSTRELMKRVWPEVVVSPETLTQRIMMLRQALGDSAENPRYVAAVRGHGYRMAASVTAASQARAAATDDTPATLPPESAVRFGPPTRRRMAQGFALVLVIGGAGLLLVRGLRDGPQVAEVVHPAAPAIAEALPIPRASVAVMPFANLTGDAAQDYLGDGIAEELINSLAHVPGLKIPARTSTFAYKGRSTDIRRIGHDLGVATVLEGSVRSTGGRLRVGARLVDAVSGFEIWSQDYDRNSSDLFALQADLATQIVQALQNYIKGSLTAPASRPSPTRDVQAYDLYLQARAVPPTTQANVERAMALLDQALARDPDFADAFGQRATLSALPAAFGIGAAAHLNDADRDARRALALNPDSADAHVSRMMIQAVRWRWAEAEQSHRAAMVTGADDPYFRNFHSEWVLRPAGRVQQAESEMMVSYHLAPADLYTLHELVVTESLLGHDEEAVRLSELARGLVGDNAPVDGEMAMLYLRLQLRSRRYGQAAKWATQVYSGSARSLRAAGGTEALQILCAALADPTQRPTAQRALRNFVPQLLSSEDFDRDKTFFVDALTMLGDLDGAYELMGGILDTRLKRAGTGGVDWSEVWRPEMRPFRQDPRFQAFVTRVKLPDYWMTYGPPDGCDFKDGKLTCH